MQCWVALLRAVNVGGTGKLPMADLVALCEAAGLINVKTYIASDNVVFQSDLGEADIKARLEQALLEYAGKPVGVIVRTGREMGEVAAANPFSGQPGNRTAALFLDRAPPADWQSTVTSQRHETIIAGRREFYIHYEAGMADSKLKIGAAKSGTVRNMNTIAKLAVMAAGQAIRG